MKAGRHEPSPHLTWRHYGVLEYVSTSVRTVAIAAETRVNGETNRAGPAVAWPSQRSVETNELGLRHRARLPG
jgi:hypothetical protein